MVPALNYLKQYDLPLCSFSFVDTFLLLVYNNELLLTYFFTFAYDFIRVLGKKNICASLRMSFLCPSLRSRSSAKSHQDRFSS